MSRLTERQKSLINAAVKYHKSLSGSAAEEFLASRGFPSERVEGYRFGYVADPEPGHEAYKGMLAIPYLRRSLDGVVTVASIRFRTLKTASSGPKYMTMPGDTPLLYNTVDTIGNPDRIAITEGELDAVTASLSGIPAVGVPGANLWKDHYARIFEGYERVYVLADGDSAGEELMKTVTKRLPNAIPAKMPPGLDVNDFVRAEGPHALRKRLGWE